MSGWHMDSELARRYAAGRADSVLAASLEAHLMSCPACRERLTQNLAAERLARVWERVTHQLDNPQPIRQRILIRLGGLRALATVIMGIRSRLDRPPSRTGRGRRWPWQVRLVVLATAVLFLSAAALSASSVIDPLLHKSATTAAANRAAHPDAIRQSASNPPATMRGEKVPAPVAAPTSTYHGDQWPDDLDKQHWPEGLPPVRIAVDAALDAFLGHTAVDATQIDGRQYQMISRAAVIFADGDTWIYTNRDPGVLILEQITIDRIEGDFAILSKGPPEGTPIAVLSLPRYWTGHQPTPSPTASPVNHCGRARCKHAPNS